MPEPTQVFAAGCTAPYTDQLVVNFSRQPKIITPVIPGLSMMTIS